MGFDMRRRHYKVKLEFKGFPGGTYWFTVLATSEDEAGDEAVRQAVDEEKLGDWHSAFVQEIEALELEDNT